MANVLITGGTGLIGRQLSKLLLEKGHEVAVLTTSTTKPAGIQSYRWDISKQFIEPEAVAGADYIIHLAGANIGEKRWTPARRKEITGSRADSGKLLFDTWLQHPGKLKAFISASATGYYGALTSEHIFTENDPPAADFLGETCRLWEQAADQFTGRGVRTVKLRTGVVLTAKGGALEKLVLPVKLGIGSAIGTGKQYMPWIHIDDLCRMYLQAIEDSTMSGAYNAVAPAHATNSELTSTIARVLHKPFWFPNVPAWVLRLAMGEMSDIVLEGSRVSSEKILKAGFSFRFPELEPALADLFAKQKIK